VSIAANSVNSCSSGIWVKAIAFSTFDAATLKVITLGFPKTPNNLYYLSGAIALHLTYHPNSITSKLMSQPVSKQRISITVDATLLQNIDCITKNRSAAVEEGLRLWYRQQIENQLRAFYQTQTPTDRQFDRDWGEFAQTQMEEILDSEGF
jgi:hypothetical protein